ncbi:hypothetical protein [Caldimonas sp. KR1-144]|uniref:hypothetical protein n=1 Tax=Caldimonas sp. KR1-144 TaxID=3400911 RepID=UPI003C0CB118
MARTPNPKAEAPVDVKFNEVALQKLDADVKQLVAIDSQAEAHVRAVALRIGYQLPADSTDPDLIQRDIAANMRRSVEACLEVGRGLTALKAACQHGQFLARLEVLGIEPRVTQRFMQAALKFANASTAPLLKAAGTQSKLFELLVLDDEQIEELALTGQTGELALDDVATMSVKELRAEVRQVRADRDFEAEKRAKAEAKRDAAEKKLRGKVPEVMPLDERLAPFQKDITERHSLMEKCVMADIEAVKALETWWLEDSGEDGPMPPAVLAVLVHLDNAVTQLASWVGTLQHTLNERFSGDLQAARQYLMQAPAGDEVEAEATADSAAGKRRGAKRG